MWVIFCGGRSLLCFAALKLKYCCENILIWFKGILRPILHAVSFVATTLLMGTGPLVTMAISEYKSHKSFMR